MFDRIIVPLDGTRFAESALAPARELARHFGSHIVVMRAEDIVGAQPAGAASDAQAELERIGEVDAYLHEVVDALRRDGFRADLVLALETAAAGIAAASEKTRSNLIVLATHLRWNAALVQQVSTTLQLLTQTHVPLLIWRSLPTGTPPGRSNGAGSAFLVHPQAPVVVPLDGSRFAESALPAAEALARMLETSLVLVRAVDLVIPERSELDHAAQAPLLRAISAAGAYLEQRQEELRARGIAAETVARVGSPLGVINGALREYDASLIVLASHGETGHTGSLLGSIAAQLIEEVEAPVLVVQPVGQSEMC